MTGEVELPNPADEEAEALHALNAVGHLLQHVCHLKGDGISEVCVWLCEMVVLSSHNYSLE